MNLKKSFLKYCLENQFEINQNQIDIVNKLNRYYQINFKRNFIKKFLNNDKNNLGFYLVGDVGVGKMRLLSSPTRFNAISGFNLEVIEFIEKN